MIKKHLLILCFLLGCCAAALGQNAVLDSLKLSASIERNVSAQAELRNAISWELFRAYSDTATKYAEQALQYAIDNNADEQIIVGRMQLGELYRVDKNLEGAKENLDAASELLSRGNFQQYKTRLALFQGNLAMAERDVDAALDFYKVGFEESEQHNPELKSKLALKLASVHQRLGELEKARYYMLEALANAKATGNYTYAIKATNNLGNFFARLQDYDTAIVYYDQSLSLAKSKSDKSGESRALLNIGNIHLIAGDWATAIEFYVSSAAIKEELEDFSGLAKLHNNIGAIYQEQGRFNESLKYYQKSIDYYVDIQDAVKQAEIMVNVGTVRVEQVRLKDGLRLLSEALQSLDAEKHPESVMTAKLNMAIAYNDLKQYDQALSELEIAETAANATTDQHSLVFIWNLRGACYFFLGDSERAISDYAKSAQLARKLGLLKEQKKALFGLYEAEQKAGNYESALTWFEQYTAVKDSLFTEASNQKLLELGEEYESKQKAEEIRSLNAENENISLENELKDKQLDLSLLSIAVVALLTIVITLYFVFRSRRQKARLLHEEEMNRERVNQLMSEQEITVLETVFQTQQNERQKLAKDVHDTLGSYLATLRYQHESAEPADVDQELKESYDATADLIAQACAEVRSISHQLATGEGFDFSLIPAVEQLVERINKTRQFEITFNNLGEAINLSQEAELTLYRLVQEILSNVMKHANAKRVVLQLNSSAEEVSLMAEDDGVGFDTASGAGQGIGMSNIRERVEQLKGKFDINSALGRGTTVLIIVPKEQTNGND